MLFIFTCVSIAVSIAMIIDKTSEMNDIQNGENIFYSMGQLYFRYNQKLRETRNRNRRRERTMRRNEKAYERREIEEFKRTERVLLEKRDNKRLLKGSNADTEANLEEEEKNLLDE